MGVGLQRYRESPGETEIRNLKLLILTIEDVLGLEIPMHDPIAVTSVDSLKYLTKIHFNVLSMTLLHLERTSLKLVLHQS